MLIEYTKPNLFRIADDFCIVAGLNDVNDSVWLKYKGHPVIKDKVKNGIIVLKETEPKKSVKKDLEGLKAYKPKEAKELVSKTYNLQTLDAWLELETRSSVIAAIESQIKSIQLEPKEEKEG